MFQHLRPGPRTLKGVTVIDSSIREQSRGSKGPGRPTTNRGRFFRLEAAYRHERLTGEHRAMYEAIVRDLWRLERSVG